MNLAVFRHTLRQHLLRLVAVVIGLVVWGTLMPIIYASFGVTLRDIIRAYPLLEQFMQFGGGNMFTLPGSIALGYIHPIAIALLAVFAIAYPLSVVAGERQRGTLEIVLARPITRRSYYLTLFVAASLFIGLSIAATLVGTAAAAVAVGYGNELAFENLPWLWLHGTALYVAIAAISFAASVSFDRAGPAAAITLAVVLVSYFFQVLGSLWPDAEWLQPYFLFYYLNPEPVLTEGVQAFDLLVLGIVTAATVVYTLVVFPRRDLAAPA
jgi:ABC-2 type transport system permease protein